MPVRRVEGEEVKTAHEQFDAMTAMAGSMEQRVNVINKECVPCPAPPRWAFWRKRHRWDDYTNALNTVSYSTLDRCRDCGLFSFNGAAW